MKTFLPLMTPAEVKEAIARQAPVLVPIGTTEVNGPHLPLGYDYLVAAALAERVSERVAGIWLPPITFGVSEALSSFPGTIWVKPATLGEQAYAVLSALIEHGFRQIFVLNNHIPNQYPVEYAIRELRRQTGVVIPSIFPAQLARELGPDLFGKPEEMGHGGEPSTSIMLALYPEAVRTDLFAPRTIRAFRGLDVISPLETSFQGSHVGLFLDIGDLTETGGWGDPTQATAERGWEIITRMVDFICHFITQFPSGDERADR
jgi:creatinine amidohydrolase